MKSRKSSASSQPATLRTTSSSSRPNDDQVKADANTIVYHTKDERIDLRGSASLEQKGNTLTGDLIHYDIVAGRVDATANSDVPVRMVLQRRLDPRVPNRKLDLLPKIPTGSCRWPH